ncbi:hypothetical protein UMZ34_25125 [Halopseudomonas pachastrellae]|nr:hypothetical protein UMZ34_25125 [Halopseudomonas pachastrellae]
MLQTLGALHGLTEKIEIVVGRKILCHAAGRYAKKASVTAAAYRKASLARDCAGVCLHSRLFASGLTGKMAACFE